MNKKMSKTFIDSTALFANPSFLKGASRVIDLFGYLDEYNYKDTDIEADFEALKRDWCIIGLDIAKAIETYERSSNISKESTTTPTTAK